MKKKLIWKRKYLSIVVDGSTAGGVRDGLRVEAIQMVLAEERIPFTKKEGQLLMNVAYVQSRTILT